MKRYAAIITAALAVGVAGCRAPRQSSVSDSATMAGGMAVAVRLDSARTARSLRLDSLRVTVEYVDSPRRRVTCEAARMVATDTALAVVRDSSALSVEESSVTHENKSRHSRPWWSGAAAVMTAFAAGVLAAWLTLRSRRRRALP